MSSFITKLEFDEQTDEYLLILPKELIEELGWAEDDEVNIEIATHLGLTAEGDVKYLRIEKVEFGD